MADSLRNSGMRSNAELINDVVAALSKTGEIVRKKQLRETLCGKLDDILALHHYLKEHSERFESEWREDFLSVFPEAGSSLPSLDDAELWQQELFNLIDSRDLSKVVDFVERIGTRKMHFEPNSAFKEWRRTGFKEEPTFVPFEIYPIGTPNDDGVYPSDYAAAQGAHDISEFLRDLVSELNGRWMEAYRKGAADAAKVSISLLFTRDAQALCDGRHVTPEEVLEQARRLGVTKLKVTIPVGTNVEFTVSYLNAFSAVGITDHDIYLTHD